MKKGLVGAVLAIVLLAIGLLATRCGGGVREELAQLDLRVVLDLQGDEIQFLYHNERLDAYEMLVEAASAQAGETEQDAVEMSLSADQDLGGRDEIHVLLTSCDEVRAKGDVEPFVFVSLQGDRSSVAISPALTHSDLDLADPVAFLTGKERDASLDILYPDGDWKDTRRDDLQGQSEIEVLEWLEPWLVAVARKVDGPALESIELIRAEGLPVFVAMGPSPGEMRLNPILLHLTAAMKHDVSKVDDQPTVLSPAPAVPSGLIGLSGDTRTIAPQADVGEVPSQSTTGTTRETGTDAASTGELGELRQAQMEAVDPCMCTCGLCIEDYDDVCVCACGDDAYIDPETGEEDKCVYGCGDDPEHCATVAPPYDSWRLAKRAYLKLFHWGALFVPGLFLWGWRRRLHRRELNKG